MPPESPASPETRPRRGNSLAGDAWRRLRRHRGAIAAIWLLAGVCLIAVLAPLLPLQPPRAVDTSRQFLAPQWSPWWVHPPALDAGEGGGDPWLAGFGRLDPVSRGLLRARVALFGRGCLASLCGTDELGRDVLARVVWGARVSLAVGVVAALVSLVIGVSYGAVSGYAGGRVDNLMMRLVDVLYSIPFIFVVIFLITILSAEPIQRVLEGRLGISRIVVFFGVVGAIYWLTMARVVRGQVLALKNEQFVEAARALGASRRRIIFVHLVPNLLGVVIVYLTLTIPQVMLFEAFLSFLGLGVEPPDVSWGLLANDGLMAITPVRISWWLVAFPSLALGLTLLALNLLGDGLRDALDPRHVRL